MSFFKENIDFGQFIGDAIFNSVNFYDANSEKLISMADEFKVLNKNDAVELKELGYSLIIADLMVSCKVNFSGKISNKEIGKTIGFLYTRFLNEIKHLDENEIKKKVDVLGKLLDVVETNEKSNNTEEELKFLLCSTFAKFYSGGNLKDKKVEGKRFAAFKLAKVFVKADIIKTMLKEFKIKQKS